MNIWGTDVENSSNLVDSEAFLKTGNVTDQVDCKKKLWRVAKVVTAKKNSRLMKLRRLSQRHCKWRFHSCSGLWNIQHVQTRHAEHDTCGAEIRVRRGRGLPGFCRDADFSFLICDSEF